VYSIVHSAQDTTGQTVVIVTGCSGGKSMYNGAYEMAGRRVHGAPLYVDPRGARFLYKASTGMWMLTNDEADFAGNRGHVGSARAAVLPTEFGLGFEVYDDDDEDDDDVDDGGGGGSKWISEAAVAVRTGNEAALLAHCAASVESGAKVRLNDASPAAVAKAQEDARRAAEENAKNVPAVAIITGFKGDNTKFNGAFEVVAERLVHGAALYKDPVRGHYLYKASFSGKWVLTDDEADFAENEGLVFSVRAAALPTEKGLSFEVGDGGSAWAVDPAVAVHAGDQAALMAHLKDSAVEDPAALEGAAAAAGQLASRWTAAQGCLRTLAQVVNLRGPLRAAAGIAAAAVEEEAQLAAAIKAAHTSEAKWRQATRAAPSAAVDDEHHTSAATVTEACLKARAEARAAAAVCARAALENAEDLAKKIQATAATTLVAVLEGEGLGFLLTPLIMAGYSSVEKVAMLSDDELANVGMKKAHIVKLKRALANLPRRSSSFRRGETDWKELAAALRQGLGEGRGSGGSEGGNAGGGGIESGGIGGHSAKRLDEKRPELKHVESYKATSAVSGAVRAE